MTLGTQPRRVPGAEAIRRALAEVREDVGRGGSAPDREYYTRHEARFGETLARFARVAPPGGRVVDLGSHFLHQAAALTLLGYEVVGADVPEFAEAGVVRDRAARFQVDNHAVPGGFAAGNFLSGEDGRVDAVMFCETLEHITFNPIAFWRRVHALLRVGGAIYITTPNAFKLLSLLGAVRGLVTGRRMGLRVDSIFEHVTYGHHWKEYSAYEVRRYFALLSPDFEVRVRRFHFRDMPSPFRGQGAAGMAKELLRRLGNATGAFAEQLEAVVTLRDRTPWRREPPDFS